MTDQEESRLDRIERKVDKAVAHSTMALNYMRVIAQRLALEEDLKRVIREDLATIPCPAPYNGSDETTNPG